MSWFDEQIKARIDYDNEDLYDALDTMAAAVMGKKLQAAYDRMEISQSALEAVLKYFGFKPHYVEIPMEIKTIENQMDYILKPYGIMRRQITLEKGWRKDAFGPMLGTNVKDGSAVALIPGRISGYYYLNIETGKKEKVTRRNESRVEREAICFYKPLPLKSLKIPDLIKFMIEQFTVSDIVLLIGSMIAVTLVGLLAPVFSNLLFGPVLESGSGTVLWALAAFMLCFSISQICIQVFQNLAKSRISIKQNVAVQAAVMHRILALPPDFFKDFSSGELNQRAQYVQNLCTILVDTVATTGLTSLFSLVYIGQIFAFAPSLVIPALTVTGITLLVTIASTLAQVKLTRKTMLLNAKASGMTYSMITGIQKIKLAGAEKRMFARWGRDYAEEAAIVYNPPLRVKLGSTIILAISLVGTMVMYYFAVKGNVSLANYYAFNTSYGVVSSAFMAFAGVATSIANIRPTLEMAKPILEAEPESAKSKEIVTSVFGAIELSNVCFRYDETMPYVINDLSLKIRPGEYVAIVGSTGCGKSTLVRLLLGFEKPQKGAIFYDRKDMAKLDLQSLRQRIGVVLQDGKLFQGDIFANITISAPQLTLDDAWKAAEMASVADDIREMPMGMNTIISEGQGGISGGQKQRLMIARAIAPKPKILIFDEATSALDNITQKKVSEAIDSLKCTRIVIAHRLSTIKHCSRIIYLDGGKIVEDGTYEELIAKNGYFAALVERQRLDI